MTAMLGSVRDVGDARRLVDLGVDIVDVLDATPATIAAARVAAPRVWASPGKDLSGGVAEAIAAFVAAGADAVKIPAPLLTALASSADPGPGAAARIVAALPADRIGDRALLDALAQAGALGAMVEPAGADDRSLLERASLAELRRFIGECRQRGLLCALSGALEPPDVPRLLAVQPDILGFRRALQGHDPHRAGVDPQAVSRLRGLIPRGEPAEPSGEAPSDRVFVRDLVVDMRIGVYARERGARQPVRFTVEVEVARPEGRRAEFRDVFSYDLITDRIRMMAESEHHDLVESVAEAVAEAALAHPRAMSVTVRVEKLAVVAGSVGVEIVRRRRGA